LIRRLKPKAIIAQKAGEQMTPMHKTYEIKVLEQRKDGGRIVINTASIDRDRDRVLPNGARIENYSRNPVVQWGHDYHSPWSTIGKTNALDISADGIVADFELRPAANDSDPQNIIRLLWKGGWIRTASIGFVPLANNPNETGGMDFTEWELLEWSLVPIPYNQDALRLAVKGFDPQSDISLLTNTLTLPPVDWTPTIFRQMDIAKLGDELDGCINDLDSLQGHINVIRDMATSEGDSSAISNVIQKRGRVLSAKNEGKIRGARDGLNEVLAEVEQQTETEGANGIEVKGAIAPHDTPKADPDTPWDGPAVVAELPNEEAVLRRVHAWVDESGDPDAKQSYKFPHHLPDGRVVLRGVNNARARLLQASIPDADRAGVDRHLTHHQDQFKSEDGDSLLDADSERDLADTLRQLINLTKEVLV